MFFRRSSNYGVLRIFYNYRHGKYVLTAYLFQDYFPMHQFILLVVVTKVAFYIYSKLILKGVKRNFKIITRILKYICHKIIDGVKKKIMQFCSNIKCGKFTVTFDNTVSSTSCFYYYHYYKQSVCNIIQTLSMFQFIIQKCLKTNQTN